MAKTLSQLRAEVDQITGEYDARFAGHSRVTRDLNDINNLISRIRSVVGELGRLPRSSDRNALEETAKTSLTLYENERKEVMRAKSLGADFEDFDTLRTEANMVFAQYDRHFAGQNRATRDLGLLGEMIEDLERVGESMREIAPTLANIPNNGAQSDIDLVTDNVKMYQTERGEIIEARGAGTVDEQAAALAEVANAQFKIYDDNFAGKNRVTRRPALLQRMITSLEQVLERMRALEKAGNVSSFNRDNAGIVEQALSTYRLEIGEIRKAREGTKFSDLQGTLGGAANDIFDLYRANFAGQDRKTRDPALMSSICDQLAEIGRQMADLGRAEPTDLNANNLRIVTDTRVMYEREWRRIAEAKGLRQPSNT